MVRAISIVIFGGFALLAALLAPFSLLMLDAPWANGGIGAGLIWLMIFGFGSVAGGSLLALRAVQGWGWHPFRAALFPAAAVTILLLSEILVHIILRQCVLICM
jgi:hypothetical protein